MKAKMSSVRVVVLSGHAGSELPEQAFALGADEVLRRPTEPDVVYRVLSKVLGQPVPESDPPAAP